MAKILSYTRPGWHDWWARVLIAAFEEDSIEFISEFKSESQIWLMKEFYKYWKDEEDIQSIDDQLILHEIIARDRLLRNISEARAVRIINCMWTALHNILDAHAPDIVTSITVDHYILDLLARACHIKGIKFIGISNCPLTGYSLISERGELNHIREPSLGEIQTVLVELQKPTYKPEYATLSKYTFTSHFIRVVKYSIKRIICRFKQLSDPLNFFYISLPFFSDRKNIFEYFSIRYFNDKYKDVLKRDKRPVVYIPLHYVPEATVDYWTKKLEFIQYEKTLFMLIETLGEEVLIVIKEHPASIGTRNKKFYKKLCDRDNVLLVSPNESSREVLSYSDCVITWTGTVGLEASLLGKAVFLLGDPYYYEESSFTKISDINSFKVVDFDRLKRGTDYNHENNERSIKIIRNLLAGTIKGSFGQKGYLNDSNAIVLGHEMQKYCRTILSK